MRASAAVSYLHPAMRAAEPDRDALHARQPRALRGHARGRGRGEPARRGAGAARRARGDPLRRRLQLAAAADALRRRPGRAPDDARDRGRCSTSRRWGRTSATTPPRYARLDHARAREPAAGARAGGDGGVRGLPDRALRLQPGRVRRLRPRRRGRRGARHPVPRRPDPDRRRGHGRPAGARRLGLALPAHGREPRLGAARLHRPDREADRPQRLLRGRGRHGADDRRRCAWRRRSAPSRRCKPYCAEPFTGPADDSDDALRAHIAAHHLRDLPPGRHLRDRLGRRRRAAGRGPRGAARGRRLGDADRAARQHQRPDDRGRRARRRPDPPRQSRGRRGERPLRPASLRFRATSPGRRPGRGRCRRPRGRRGSRPRR